MHLSRAASVLAIALSAFACSSPGSAGSNDVPSEDVQRGSGAAVANERAGAVVQGVATFTATDVARILLVLEQTALTQAKLAEDRAVTIEVKTYAARMVRERGEMVDRLTDILTRATTRSEDPTPALLEEDAMRAKTALSELDRRAFDLCYMTEEVSVHARMLGLLEASLVPSTSRSDDPLAAELAEELLEIRTMTASQIVHALRVQGVLRVARAPTPPTGPDGIAAAEGTATSP